MKIARVPAANEKFELTDVEIPEPGRGHVRVKVHACGVCHSDSLTVVGAMGNSFPRAPGHEVAGVVDAVGEGVTTWNVGDRVGVGWFGGCDFTCEPCRRGDFISCENGQVPGIAYDGGYAEYMVAPAEALARIPDDLSDVDAAPLLCAGITTFNALRESVARPGDRGRHPRGRRARPPRRPVRGQDGLRGRRDRARQGQGAVGERAWRAPLHRLEGLRRRRGAEQARRRAGRPRDGHRRRTR